MNELNLIDLFSGCGGLGLGFHQAGFSTYLANELHPDPARTYIENILSENPEKMLIGSICDKLSTKNITKPKLKRNEIDCIAGGPPCQGFSMAGSGFADDPRNNLYMEYLRVIQEIEPKSIVFENVPGFANRYGRNHREFLEKKLTQMGYETHSGILRASDYNVPQLRKRFYCIGVKKDYLNDHRLGFPEPKNLKQDSSLTAFDVISDLDTYHLGGGYGSGEIFGPDKYLKPARSDFQKEMRKISGLTTSGHTYNTKIPNHTDKVIKRMMAYQLGNTKQSLIGTEIETKKLSQRVLKKNSFPSITVVSLPDDYIHYNRKMPRTLSVRECARFQTFPDDFVFYGKRTTGGKRRKVDVPQYTQVGNAIPPRLANTIAEYVRELITS